MTTSPTPLRTGQRTLPDFLGIGAPRAGTSWLRDVLSVRPDIFLPAVKELRFFSTDYEAGFDWYSSWFADATTSCAGEICPCYLADPSAPARIARLLPRVRLIAVLRNPVEQIRSLHRLRTSLGRYTCDLRSAVDEELLENVFYYRHITRYLQHFDARQVLVVLYDDLAADRHAFLQRLFAFLDLEPVFPTGLEQRVNGTSERRPRFASLERMLEAGKELTVRYRLTAVRRVVRHTGLSTALRRLNSRQANWSDTDAEVGQYIRNATADDVRSLESLLERDLSCWGY